MQENNRKWYTATIIQDSEHYIKQASARDAFVNLFKSNRIRNPDKGYTSEAAQGPDDLQRNALHALSAKHVHSPRHANTPPALISPTTATELLRGVVLDAGANCPSEHVRHIISSSPLLLPLQHLLRGHGIQMKKSVVS